MSKTENSNQLIKDFWDNFFRDHFKESIDIANQLIAEGGNDLGAEYLAKVYLKQGRYQAAEEVLKDVKKYCGIKLFVDFVVHGNLAAIKDFNEDVDSLIYKSQCLTMAKIYYGDDEITDALEDPDLILEKVFKQLVGVEEIDRAILAYSQYIELLFREQELAKDILLPIAHEQIDNLIELSKKAKYDSTRAKVFLLKAKLFKDREAAEDAEILFGKDQNKNGLAEVYTFYATECEEKEFYVKALDIFKRTGNLNAQGFIYESKASSALMKGNINDACLYFDKAKETIDNAGIFEKLGLEIQTLSLHAVKGEFKILHEKAEIFLNSGMNIPRLFLAQVYQILATSLLYTHSDLNKAKDYIEKACDCFLKLKKYNQLLNAKNIHFQFLCLEDDLDEMLRHGEETIQIANRLERYEDKAAKYVDLAFAIIKVNADRDTLDKDKLDLASDYFQKAIQIHQEQENLVGEADVYQAMGNMFANVAKLEESFKCLLKAKEIYRKEKVLLQASITSILIGLLVGDEAIVNETTYPIASEHFETALEYFDKEKLMDLVWKTNFYLAELNERLYVKKNDKRFRDLAQKHYVDMHKSAIQFEENADSHEVSIGATTIDEAFNKAHQFFRSINEPELSTQFFRNNN